MIKQAIILAGGLGTRLREAVPDLPKCMAPVAGRPFLYHVINYLRLQGIERFIFSLGYKHEVIESWLADEFAALEYEIVIESEPLGTGGAILLAGRQAQDQNVLVTNGDTLFKIDLATLAELHEKKNAACTLALKPMEEFDRYGVVEVDRTGIVTKFKEKQFYHDGLINGGVYLVRVSELLKSGLPEKFSFEKDFLEQQVSSGKIAGLAQHGYFIDIGIPEDFDRAQKELAAPVFNLANVASDWSLFLDRDGVINEDKPGSYIFTPDEFVFMHGAPSLFKKLTDRFAHIFVATNQRGVGRKLMTEQTLTAIHDKMSAGIATAGGRLDAIYYATSIDNKSFERKPNPGMALEALAAFPDVQFSRSIMIGNNISDMQFGRGAGMFTVFVRTTNKEVSLPHPDIDLIFDSLEDFAKAL